MHRKPPHTVSTNELIGKILQCWQMDNTIDLPEDPDRVMTQLELQRDDIEGKLEFAAHSNKYTPDTKSLQQRLSVTEKYQAFGNQIAAVLKDEVVAHTTQAGSSELNIEFVTHEGDIYQNKEPYFTTASAYRLAQKYGVEVSDWAPPDAAPTGAEPSEPASSTSPPERDWSKVSIQLRPDDCISFRIGTGKWTTKHLASTKFVDKRKTDEVTPNKAFEVLATLPLATSFGAGRGRAKGQDRARKKKLTDALRDLVGINGDPFTARAPDKGYEPHFSIEDKRLTSYSDGDWNTEYLKESPEFQ